MDDPAAEGAHDPPAAGVGAERDRAAAATDHPERAVGSPCVTYPPVSSARKMTPIVFCASCRPWPSAIAAAETVCASRKPRLTLCGLRAAEDPHDREHQQRTRRTKPTTGESTIGMRTLSMIAAQCDRRPGGEGRADQAADQRVRGRRGQAEVPGDEVPGDRAEQRRPARSPGPCVARRGRDHLARRSWRPPGPRKAPTKFITAAIASATRGVSARVETEVAMALAASWKPLV